MVQGTLEVLLVGAKGLDNSDFLNNIDPYVLIRCRTQEQKSSVASVGAGSTPEWNETFAFTISGDVSELVIRIMDRDCIGDDDFLGEAKIPLDPVFEEGSLPAASYNVVKDEKYCGEIRVGLNFKGEVVDRDLPEEDYGGWKESSYHG